MVDVNRDLTREEKIAAISRVAMPDKMSLKRWLRESDREYLIFCATDLMDGLSWPDGVCTLMEIIEHYREARGLIETGETEPQRDPQGDTVEVPVRKTERLTKAEGERAIRQIARAIQAEDPTWTLGDLV